MGRAGEGAQQAFDGAAARGPEPGDLVRLAAGDHGERQQDEEYGTRGAGPVAPHAAGHTGEGQGGGVREQDQYGELVQQDGDGDDPSVRAPADHARVPGETAHGLVILALGPVPAPVPARVGGRRPRQQQRRCRDPGGDQRVRRPSWAKCPAIGVTAYSRPAHRPTLGGRAGPPGPRPDPRSRRPRRARGRAERPLGVEGEDGVHEEVVEAVHRVHGVQQLPDLRERAPRHLEGDRLVPPHPATIDPPQTDPEHDEYGYEHGDGNLRTLDDHAPDFVLLVSLRT